MFATWVGTVIAFYFTNESFRQAAQSTREAVAARTSDAGRVTDRMIPFEKVAKLVKPRAGVRQAKMAEVMTRYGLILAPPKPAATTQ